MATRSRAEPRHQQQAQPPTARPPPPSRSSTARSRRLSPPSTTSDSLPHFHRNCTIKAVAKRYLRIAALLSTAATPPSSSTSRSRSRPRSASEGDHRAPDLIAARIFRCQPPRRQRIAPDPDRHQRPRLHPRPRPPLGTRSSSSPLQRSARSPSPPPRFLPASSFPRLQRDPQWARPRSCQAPRSRSRSSKASLPLLHGLQQSTPTASPAVHLGCKKLAFIFSLSVVFLHRCENPPILRCREALRRQQRDLLPTPPSTSRPPAAAARPSFAFAPFPQPRSQDLLRLRRHHRRHHLLLQPLPQQPAQCLPPPAPSDGSCAGGGDPQRRHGLLVIGQRLDPKLF